MKYWNSKHTDKVLEQYDYTYDKNSNILSEHAKFSYDNNLKDELREYSYDSLDRLVKTNITNNFTYETLEITYSFDKVGNRTSMTEDSVITTYTYNDLDQLIKSVEVDGDKSYITTYEYDKKGNQVRVTDKKEGTVTENTYDVQSQLISVKITKNGEVIATQENEYNGEGQRISKTDNGVKTCYYYEGSLLLYTTDSDGNKTSQNIYGNQDNVISSIRYDDGQKAYFYSKDIQGSTSVITDEDGKCVTSYDYTDYGETTKTVNAYFYNEICYTGGVYDELTGQYYLNARYYDPESGVFLSQDTYRGEEDEYATWNLYAYCAGNPIKYVDPSGHDAVITHLWGYGATNAWNPSGWVALGVAGIATVGVVAYAYTKRDEISIAISNVKAKSSDKPKKESKVKAKVKKALKKLKKTKKRRGTKRAPKQGKKGQVYEQINNKGEVMSRTKYDSKGRPKYRDDYTHTHYSKKFKKDLKPHRHKFKYNKNGQRIGEEVVPIKVK